MDVIYLDFQKAFDKVLHKRLLIKIRAYGVGGKVLVRIEDWQKEWRKRVFLWLAAVEKVGRLQKNLVQHWHLHIMATIDNTNCWLKVERISKKNKHIDVDIKFLKRCKKAEKIPKELQITNPLKLTYYTDYAERLCCHISCRLLNHLLHQFHSNAATLKSRQSPYPELALRTQETSYETLPSRQGNGTTPPTCTLRTRNLRISASPPAVNKSPLLPRLKSVPPQGTKNCNDLLRRQKLDVTDRVSFFIQYFPGAGKLRHVLRTLH
eukprot:g43835.t1